MSFFGFCAQEIAKADLKSLQDQFAALKTEVEELEGSSAKLDRLYAEQDEILDKVFNGAYGSDRENQLESQLDVLEMERHRVVDASYKWQQAQVMTSYAYEQLKFACKKWTSISQVDQRLVPFIAVVCSLHLFFFCYGITYSGESEKPRPLTVVHNSYFH